MVTTPKRVERVEDLEKTDYVKNFCDIFIEDNDTKQEYLQKWEHVTNNKNVFFKSKTKEEIQENFSVYNPNVSYQEAINLLTEILSELEQSLEKDTDKYCFTVKHTLYDNKWVSPRVTRNLTCYIVDKIGEYYSIKTFCIAEVCEHMDILVDEVRDVLRDNIEEVSSVYNDQDNTVTHTILSEDNKYSVLFDKIEDLYNNQTDQDIIRENNLIQQSRKEL